MILSGGSLVLKQTDIVSWRGNTTQFDGRALDLLGVWTAYDRLYTNNPWITAPVNKIANATARLPLKVYRRTADSREDARDTPYGELLARPSQRIDSFTFWYWVRQILDIYGESFLGKIRDRGGRPVELVPLHPTSMRYDDEKNKWSYDDGKKRIENIPRRDLVHFRHVHPMSVRGLSPLESLRRTLQLEAGMMEGFAAPFSNGARPSVLLHHPRVLSKPGADRLKAGWDDVHSGAANWGKTVILEEGMTASVLPINFEELQYIEARKLGQVECCAVYDVAPTVLHILDHATYSNITEQNRALYRDTMAPKLGHLESTMDMELRDGSMGERNVEPDFPDNVYGEFLMDEVLRGDFEARALSYSQSDFMTIAEKRQKENLPFIEGTNRIFLNSASLPLGPDGQLERPAAPEPPALPPAPEQLALPPAKVARALTGDTLRTLMGRLSRKFSLDEIDPTVFVSGLSEGTAQVLKTLAEANEAGESVDAFKQRLKNLTVPESDTPQQPVFISHTVVNPEKEVPATVVESHNHMDAPQITVEPASVTLPPMQVVVQAAPLRAMRRTVERDDNGRIVAVVDTPIDE